MTTPTLVAILAGCTTLIAFLLLIGRAFARGAGWGVAVMLLSPVSAIAYGVRFWRQEKLPFLTYLFMVGSTAGLCLFLFSSWGGWELVKTSGQVKQAIIEHTLTVQDVDKLLRLSEHFDRQSGFTTTSSSLLLQAHKELAHQAQKQAAEDTAAALVLARQDRLGLSQISRKSHPEKTRYRLTYVTIDIGDASRYVGSTVKVTRKGVVEKEYRLLKVSGNRLELSQRAGSGSYQFRFRGRDIEKIRVLTKQPY